MIYPASSKLEWAEMPSGLIIPADCKPKPKPKGFDFFAGCGGFSLGFIQAGFQVVGALEIDFSAAQTYMCNLGTYPIQIHFDTDERKKGFEKHLQKQFDKLAKKKMILPIRHDYESIPLFGESFDVAGSGWINMHPEATGVGHFWIADICNLSGKQILDTLGMEVGEMDCIFGGPPCQGFSNSNHNRDETDIRNLLVFEFARMIAEMRPISFSMENVPEILNMETPEGINIIDAFCSTLADWEYSSFESLRRALLGRKGAKAVIRREKKEKVKPKSKPKQKVKAAQASLF